MKRLTDKQRQLLHNLNMAARDLSKTNDMHEWYYYHCKWYEMYTQKEIIKYYGLQKYYLRKMFDLLELKVIEREKEKA